jgi:eukaryotic-like serine/threonine-protein kinase
LNASDIIDGRYRLERLLGTGGMAEVWLAEDQRLGRWVAVKALREAFDETLDAETIAAFEREATVIARLQHQNIVAVHDAGSHEGRRYIVMEYVHGYSLRQLLETQGRLTEAEAIRYGTQVASALQYAHGLDVIHCDIKPENILINENGVAKVADFGVAETLTRTMTPRQAADLLGTVAYLAPEVIEGASPSPASDIYSLGLTVFEAIAGRLPFSGSTAGASIGQRLATPAPALRTFSRGASPEMESVLAKALSLSPRDRYANAGAFGQALRRVPLHEGAPVAPVVAPPGRPPQLHGHNTARVRRGAVAPPPAGVSAGTILLAVGVLLAALGLGVVAALIIANSDDDGGGGTGTPTPTVTVDATTAPTQGPTQTRPPGTTPSPTAAPSPTATPPQATPTSQGPTRTPTRTAPAPTAQPTAPAATATVQPTAAATPTPN